ncbi:hypothetical protein ACSFE6_19125 [Pseudomonas baetica]|uniref:hypothetical protein n=1 Tax=Pseudomonas baetica TaxID=674054 RepID=UPI003EEBE2EA
MYNGLLTTEEIPESLRDEVIHSQESLERSWTSIAEQLRTQPLTEEDVLQTLKAGFLQTPHGKVLAPLFVDAILRSIKPLDGLTPKQLREIVEVICGLPPHLWADTLGEHINFPRGHNGEGVHGFIQNQLTQSRLLREQRIADGELLDNDTWKAVCDFTKQARQYVRRSAEGPLNTHLRQLEDHLHVRPSPKDAQMLVALFVEALNTPEPAQRQRWPERFAVTAQALQDRLQAIEINDSRPELSDVVHSTLSKIATPLNAALTRLGAISLKVVADGIGSVVEQAYDTLGCFVFFAGSESVHVSGQQADNPTAESELLLKLQEIEKRSSFYDEVSTSGPHYTGGFLGKVLFVANALDTVGVLGIADKVRPHLPAVPTPAPVVVPLEAPDVSPVSVAELLDRVKRTEKEVYEFLAPQPPTPEAEAREDIGNDANPPEAIQSTSSARDGLDVEQMARAIGDILRRIDDALTFPSASANELQELLGEKQEDLEALSKLQEELDALRQIEPVGPLQVPPTSWWEPIAQQLNNVLLRLSTALATYSLGAASTALQLARDNPGASVTAAFVAASTLYNEYRQSLPDPAAPGTALPPAPESPALHQERLEDDIEQILAQPVAAGEPVLSQSILNLMYQSTERDLLDDEQLIEEVALELQQPSPQAPEKTYLELIRELQATEHVEQTSVKSTQDVHHIRKRNTAAFKASALSFNAREEDVEPTPDIEESEESEEQKVANLDQYLKTMEALQSVATDIDQSTDDSPSETATGTAKQVIHLLRHRRAVTWMDDSRAAGDTQLVNSYAHALNKFADGTVQYTHATVVVPMHSTFGQCYLNLINAFKNPFFIDWAQQANIELPTVRVNTADSTLTAKVKGVETTFKLDDNTGWGNVAGPILRTAGIVDPTYIGVAYPIDSSTPLALVSGFQGERSAPTQAQARQRARELAANQVFDPIASDDPLRPLELRSEANVEKQRQNLGDLYTHHALITGLTDLIKGKSDGASVNLNACLFATDKNSLFASRYPQEAQRLVTAQRFIDAMGWKMPKNVGEVLNLIKVLSFVLPESTEQGDYKGALGYDSPLTTAHIQTIRQTVQRLEKPMSGGLLVNLLQSQSVTSPDQGLNLALNSAKGKLLGSALESNLNAISTPGSATEWVMAALLLDIDPTPGTPRNHVAGYNLTQSANWGEKPSTVVGRLEAHLLAIGKVSATTAPVAAWHLLSAFAPEFLVTKMPDNLVCGSHTWASFRIAVARIEQLNPGATRKMSFEQVMSFGSTQPITAGQEIATQSVSVNPLIDWAIANGVLMANASDTYTTTQLGIAREKFNAVRTEMANARDALTADVPTREQLALTELERVFGKDLPYKKLCLSRRNIPQGQPISMYSLLDLYITGQLTPGIWKSYDARIRVSELEGKFSQLKSAESIFKKSFTSYFDNLRSGSESVFKYLVSQLPLEDRQSLEYGSQKFYSVRSAINEDRHSQTSEKIEAHKGRHGVLIRSEYKGKVAYYEVFPGSVEIRKNTQLPANLKLNGEIKTFRSRNDPSGYIQKQCATPQPVDWDAYKKGSAPRNGITSDVIIEDIQPVTQQATFYPQGYNFDKAPNAFSPSSRIDYLAKVAVDEHFVVGREKLESLARGSTNSENEKAFKSKLLDFFSSLVPFKSCIDNISQGNVGGAVFDCLLDAAGFVIPGGVAAGQAVKVAKTTGKFVPKAMKMTWIMTSSLVSSANPLDGVGDLLRFGKNAVCKLGTTAYRAAGVGIDQIKNLYGTTKAVDHGQLLKRADIAEGVVGSKIAGQSNSLTALFKNGKWYAFDAARNRPYGPPLENFRPASSIPLELTTFSDGSTAFTPSRLFDTEPHTIQRLSGEVDVVVGVNVLRFNPEQPNTLTDITSPAYNGKLDGFDAVCSRGGKSKKGITCLSKSIQITRAPEQQRAQAIEHKRLYPSIENPQVIHERRAYKVDGTLGEAKPAPNVVPMHFKSETTGSIIDDQHFGFSDKHIDDELEKKTRIVRVNAIVNGVDDMRDVRAFQVDIPGFIYGKYNYLVAEVDTGLFYYCSYDKKKTDNIVFTRLDYEDNGLAADLIKGFHKAKDPLLSAALVIPNQPFLALPSLETLYKNLEDKKGFTPDDIEALKKKVELFSDEQKREFIITTWNKGNELGVEVYIPEIRVNIAAKPPGFATFSEDSKNRFYASIATQQVEDQFEATGLGSFNKLLDDDVSDKQRVALAQPIVLWEYFRSDSTHYAEMILKTGAGNCDQMAYASAATAITNGGDASIWRMPGAHVFTVVGIPQGTYRSTIDFSEPEYVNIWVSDPWVGIHCPASQYMEQLKDKMTQWNREGRKIISTDRTANPPVNRWTGPLEQSWFEPVILGPKETGSKKSP